MLPWYVLLIGTPVDMEEGTNADLIPAGPELEVANHPGTPFLAAICCCIER
jgi:hypothetical protein